MNSTLLLISPSNESLIKNVCSYRPNGYLSEKFALVTIFGTIICIIGFINNCFLLKILSKSPLITTHVFYLAILAICDIITEFCYVALLSVQVLFDYIENLFLYLAWNGYLKIVFTLAHISMTVSTYMIVSASAERYFTSSNSRRNCTKRHRWLITASVIWFGLISKGLVYWEIDVIYRENCTGFGAYYVKPSALALNPPYKIGYTLWFRHIIHVFFPFILLLCLNGAILSRLKKTPVDRVHEAMVASMVGNMMKERKKNIKRATLMLVAIVSTYLFSNLLNVIITIWEHVDLEHLHNQPRFYTFAVDTVSLLTIFTGAIRFPIYCACNQQLRKEVMRMFKFCNTCLYCRKKKTFQFGIGST